MRLLLSAVSLSLLGASPVRPEVQAEALITAELLRGQDRFLSSDLLEGAPRDAGGRVGRGLHRLAIRSARAQARRH